MSDGFIISDVKLKMDEGFKNNLTLEEIFEDDDEIEWCKEYLYLKDRYYKTGEISFEDIELDKDYFKIHMREMFKYENTDDVTGDIGAYNRELMWMAHLEYDEDKDEYYYKEKELYEYDLKRQKYFEYLTFGFWHKIDRWRCISRVMQILRNGIEYYFFEKWYDIDVIEQKLLTNSGKDFGYYWEGSEENEKGWSKKYTILSDSDKEDYKLNYETLVHNAISEFKKYISNYKEEDFPIILSSKYINEKINDILKEKENYDEDEKYSNKRFNSKDEKVLYEKLCNKFGKDNVLKEYKSTIYPWNCDFYIKDKNMFIEYQGTWSHFGKAWEGSHGEKIKLTEMLKKLTEKNKSRYMSAIKNWTIMDSAKRQWAKNHNLNWIEFFNIEDMSNWIENFA